MSVNKKSSGKRKRPSPSPATTTQISRRLEKFRGRQRNLWNDDYDIDETEPNPLLKSKEKPPIDNTYIVLSDSDDDKGSSRKRSRSHKPKKKSSQISEENFSSDNDYKIMSKCPSCLICSILSKLTSYNCCQKHLALLVHNHQKQQKQTTNSDQWPPQQVMILPVTDELIQRYLNPQEIYRLRTRTSLSPREKKTTESKRTKRKLSKKSTNTSDPSDTERTNVAKSKSSQRSTRMETEQISSSSSSADSSLPDSQTNPPDVTYTVITSTSTTINSFESPTMLDTCQLQHSSDQPIGTDDSQSQNVSNNTSTEKKQNDPWTPISDETHAAIETAFEQVDQHSPEAMEFTPAIARRTPTELMASRLPKIQLKKGRYHRGQPVADKSTLEKTTTTTTNESHSLNNISQSSSTSTSISAITTNTRLPTSLATIIEDESLIIQPTYPNSDKPSQSCQLSSNRHDHTKEGLSDTVMSCLFAQDESSQQDLIHSTTKSVSNEEVLSSTTAILEERIPRQNENNQSENVSQSSQLTNDQNDSHSLISSTTNDKPMTPKKSFLCNPDGSITKISGSLLTHNHQTPSRSSRRKSTDRTPATSHLNKEKL